jgi:amino acid transporter
MQGKRTFVRESSGLIREIDAKDAFSMNFSYLGPAAGVAYTLTFAVALVGASWIISGVIAALLMFPVAIMYYYLSRIIPRSAGDYIKNFGTQDWIYTSNIKHFHFRKRSSYTSTARTSISFRAFITNFGNNLSRPIAYFLCK